MKQFIQRLNSLTTTELTLIVLMTNIALFLVGHFSNYQHCVNYRSEFALHNLKEGNQLFFKPFKGVLVQIEECLQDKNCNLRNIESADDVGGNLVLWLGNKITPVTAIPTTNPYQFRDPQNHPLATKVFYHLVHLAALFLFCWVGRIVLNNVTVLAMGLSLSLFENFFFVTYSYDVYFFPIYTIILSLILLRPQNFSMKTFIILSIFTGLTTWFRSSAWPVFVFGSILLLGFNFFSFKTNLTQIKKIMLALILASSIHHLPDIYFTQVKHPFWHTIHAGLFEKGGFVLPNNVFIPKHLYSKETSNTTPLYTFERWADQIQYLIVKDKAPNAKIGSTEYELILKSDYLNFWRLHFKENLYFYISRVPLVFSANPFKPHFFTNQDESPYITESVTVSTVFSFLFFIFLFFFLYSKKHTRLEKYFFLIVLGTASIPGILVHPGLITYNIPVLFAEWLIIFYHLSKMNVFCDKSTRLGC